MSAVGVAFVVALVVVCLGLVVVVIDHCVMWHHIKARLRADHREEDQP